MVALSCGWTSSTFAAEELVSPVVQRPRVPGILLLDTRARHATRPGASDFVSVTGQTRWEVSQTAIVVCDMWSGHFCQASAHRVAAMAPRMNEVLSAARDHGVTIIHAPSGGVYHYEKTPQRRRMREARHFNPPVEIRSWTWHDRTRERPLPIDDTGGGCDDPEPQPLDREFDRRQHPAIGIVGYDGVSDSGQEIYNYCRQEGITNIVLMGIHTNMCILSRPFGIRQLHELGFNVVLCRDLTDALYDPRAYPYVSHARGTELVVEHIETYWCPSILSDNLMRVLPRSADPQVPSPNRSAPQATAAR